MKFATVCAIAIAAASGADVETETKTEQFGSYAGPATLGISGIGAGSYQIGTGSKQPSYGKTSYKESTYEPVYSKPAYKEPAYVEPTYSKPAYREPSYSKPAYKEPAYVEPLTASYKEPSYDAPAYGKPAYKEPSYDAPAYSKPAYKEPSYSAPAYSKPAYVEPKKSVSYDIIAKSPLVKGSSYGQNWVRRSTIRPRDVKAYNAEPVDAYYFTDESITDETIIASCEMDFQGYHAATGRVELRQNVDDLTAMVGEFKGLPEGLHALKIHEFGDLEYGCESIGDVYNPFGVYAGKSNQDINKRRVGDIKQVKGNTDYTAVYRTRDLLVNLSGPNSVIGRSMAMYEADDSGKLGDRQCCCVIGLAEGEKPYPTPVQRVHIRGEPKGFHSGSPQFSAGFGNPHPQDHSANFGNHGAYYGGHGQW